MNTPSYYRLLLGAGQCSVAWNPVTILPPFLVNTFLSIEQQCHMAPSVPFKVRRESGINIVTCAKLRSYITIRLNRQPTCLDTYIASK